MNIEPQKIKKIGKTSGPSQNTNNTAQKKRDDHNELESSENTVQLDEEKMVTKDDTVDSLREKFPNVNLFELEFLLFLKAKKSSE